MSVVPDGPDGPDGPDRPDASDADAADDARDAYDAHDAHDAEEVAAPHAADRPIRVVIADDQPVVRAGFAAILDAQPDIEVRGEASDGRQAVEVARRVRPDVVLMDVRMPVLDGIAATTALAGPGVEDPVRILVLTTFDLDEHVHDALRAGASGFLLKDLSRSQLVDAVRTVARGDALLAPSVTRRLLARLARPAPAARVDEILGDLTDREREVLVLMGRGRTNGEIAAELHLGQSTVKTRVDRVFTKLACATGSRP